MIGTGVFTSLGFQLVHIQSVFSLLMLWLIGGLIAFCGALSYCELGTALPRSGGEYHILSQVVHPSIGFSAGIVSATIGFTAPAVLAAMALGSYINALFPLINETVLACFVIIFLHCLHISSIKWGTLFQKGATVLKIGLILLFIIFGILSKPLHIISLVPKTEDLFLIFSPEFAIGLIWVSYSYTGWNSIVYIAGELKAPKTNISKSMFISTGLVMLLYLLLNYTFLYTTSIGDMTGKVDIGYVTGLVIFGEIGSKIVALGISILLLSTVSSYVYIGPRIMQIMGEDHKFLSFLKSPKNEIIPSSAFYIQLIISFMFLFTSSFEQVLMYAGITLIITTSLTVISLFILRYTEPHLNRPYKVWGYPFTPLIYLITNFWILFYSFRDATFESIIGLGIVLLSIIIYFLLNRRYQIR